MEENGNLLERFPDALHIQLSDNAVSTIDGTQGRPTQGEIILVRTQDNQLVLNRFALMAEVEHLGIISKVSNHGVVEIRNIETRGPFTSIDLNILIASFVSHSSIEGGYYHDEDSYHVPHHLPTFGELSLRLQSGADPEARDGVAWRVESLGYEGRRQNEYETDIDLFESIVADWTDSSRAIPINFGNALLNAPGTAVRPRVLKVRPIWVGDNALIPTDIRRFIMNQINEAKELWSRAQIIIEPVVESGSGYPFVVNNAKLAIGIDPNSPSSAKFASRDDWLKGIQNYLIANPALNLAPKIGTIDVYFANWRDTTTVYAAGNPTPFNQTGGGYTLGSNTAFATVFVTDRPLPSRVVPPHPVMRWMNYLVAHELGHVLGFKHPLFAYNPSSNPLRADGQLSAEKLRIIGYRLDPVGSTLSVQDAGRMQNMIQSFDAWANPRVRAYNSINASPSNVLSGNVMALGTNDVGGVNLSNIGNRTVQEYIDKMVELAPAPNQTDNPVLFFFMSCANVSNPTAPALNRRYYTGTSLVRGFPIPVVIFNRSWDINCAAGAQWTACFPEDIYFSVLEPRMRVPKFGTVMDAETPDPAVIDAEICEAVGFGTGIELPTAVADYVGAVVLNPALSLSAAYPNPAATKPTTSFEMYIPTTKGDVGRIARNDWWNEAVYHSPYMWNTGNDLSVVTEVPTGGGTVIPVLEKIRKEFYEPASPMPQHQPPEINQANYLYIHVRLRANHFPADLNGASNLRDYFLNRTRVYVGLRFPGSGGTAASIKPLNIHDVTINGHSPKWYCDTVVESITVDNSLFTNTTPDTSSDPAHPYVAGFTVCYPWTPPTNLPKHFCICAFVISANEDLKGYGNTPLVTWQQVTSNPNWGINNLTITDVDWVTLSNTNLQWMWRNMAKAIIPRSLRPLNFPLPPIAVHLEPFEEEPPLVYQISKTDCPEVMDVFINRFDKTIGGVKELVIFDESGIATVPIGNSELRSGLYGLALSVDWKNANPNFSLYVEPHIGTKVLDGYRFDMLNADNGAEDNFAQEVFGTIYRALYTCREQFSLRSASQLFELLEAINPVNMNSMIEWANNPNVFEKFYNLKIELDKIPGDYGVVLQGFEEFMQSISGDDHIRLLVLLNSFFEHLHFFALLYSDNFPTGNGNNTQ